MKTSHIFPSSPISSKPKCFGMKLLGVLLLLVSFSFSATMEIKCIPKNLKKFNGLYELYITEQLTDEDGLIREKIEVENNGDTLEFSSRIWDDLTHLTWIGKSFKTYTFNGNFKINPNVCKLTISDYDK